MKFNILASILLGAVFIMPTSYADQLAKQMPQKKILENRIQEFIQSQANGVFVKDGGVSIAVVKNGEVILSNAYGYRDRESRLPVTEDTVFQVGSTTKSFAALTFAMLADAGKLSLDEPLNHDGDPLIQLKDERITRALSVVDILSHRSGLPGNDLLWILTSFSRQELFSRVKYLDLKPGAFREESQYNNILYMASRLPFEKVNGDTWEDFLKSRVLDPLEMSSSTTSNAVATQSQNFALPYFGETKLERRNVEPIGPAGALNSSLKDMTTWLRFHLDGGKTLRGDRLISEVLLDNMYSPHAVIANPIVFLMQGQGWLGKKVNYGLGWFLGEVDGKKTIFHSGNVDGFSSLIVFIPELSLGTVILTNQNISTFPGLLAQQVFEQLLGKPIPNSFEMPQMPIPEVPPTVVLDFPDASLTGTYESNSYGPIKIEMENNNLTLIYFNHRWPLRYIGSNTFSFAPTVFGREFALSLTVQREAVRTSAIDIPFSFDPAVPQIRFKKKLSRASLKTNHYTSITKGRLPRVKCPSLGKMRLNVGFQYPSDKLNYSDNYRNHPASPHPTD